VGQFWLVHTISPSLPSIANPLEKLRILTLADPQGSLSDRFGKKWFIVTAGLIGVVGSAVSASAHATTTIVAGNVLTGVANAGCIMGVPAGQEVTPNRLRPWTMGFSQLLASCAVIAGTLAAGAFVKFHSWRWSYGLNAFVYAAAALLVLAFYHPPPPVLLRREQRSRRRRRHAAAASLLARVDHVGILLLTGSIAALLIALTWGGTTYAWSAGQVVAPLVVGCAGLGAFGVWEWRGTTEGIFDHRLFRDSRNFPILLLVCVVDGMLLLGVNVLFAQEVATLFTTDAMQIAATITPFLATSAFGCLPAGIIMARTKSYRTMLVGCLLWCSLFTGMSSRLVSSRVND
jgi:MFS family permease